MPSRNASTIDHDDGWLVTPRALTSVATIVSLVYTLHAPVRYVLHVGETVNALSARVTTLETEIDRQRGTIVAAELVLSRNRDQAARPAPPAIEPTPRRPRPSRSESSH